MTRLYISGPVSGLEYALAKANFSQIENVLKYHGFETVNPLSVQAINCKGQLCLRVEPEHDNHHSWECWLKHDLAEMLFCDGIAMLPDWEDSFGARLEVATAIHLKMPAYPFEYWVNKTRDGNDG